MGQRERVAVLGASPNPARYSNRAMKRLAASGHEVHPVNPEYEEIEGVKVCPDIDGLPCPVDTVTVYLSPARVIPYIPQILAAKPKRVILNPGAESEALEEALKNAKIECVKGCTLVMLSTGQF